MLALLESRDEVGGDFKSLSASRTHDLFEVATSNLKLWESELGNVEGSVLVDGGLVVVGVADEADVLDDGQAFRRPVGEVRPIVA